MKTLLVSKSMLSAAAMILAASFSSAHADVITPTAAAIGYGQSGPAYSHATGDIAVGGAGSFTEFGITYTNIGANAAGVQVKIAPNDGNGAQPFDTAGNYLSVLGGGVLQLDFTATSALGLYWGSIDPGNKVEFFDNGVSVGSLTGAQIATLQPLLQASGDQFAYSSNRFITFTDSDVGQTFDRIVLTSTNNSFEFFNVQAVPEASTWAMMIFGFLGLGFLGYRKSSKASGAAFRIA